MIGNSGGTTDLGDSAGCQQQNGGTVRETGKPGADLLP